MKEFQNKFISVIIWFVRYVEQNGFVNYFGTQRFGATGIETGLALLKRNWVEAARLLLRPPTVPISLWNELFENNPQELIELIDNQENFRVQALLILKNKGVNQVLAKTFFFFYVRPSGVSGIKFVVSGVKKDFPILSLST